jgi:cold shock protein
MMQTGTVKFFNPICQFRFITPDDGGDNIYVHDTAVGHARLHGVMEKGLRVSFATAPDRRGTGLKTLSLKLVD